MLKIIDMVLYNFCSPLFIDDLNSTKGDQNIFFKKMNKGLNFSINKGSGLNQTSWTVILEQEAFAWFFYKLCVWNRIL